jgi:hypothetical protein
VSEPVVAEQANLNFLKLESQSLGELATIMNGHAGLCNLNHGFAKQLNKLHWSGA